MKKFLYLITILSFISCTKDGLTINGHYGSYWQAVILEDFKQFEPFIDAPQGWKARWGETLTFVAKEVPGYTFVSWDLPSWGSYCNPDPVIDPSNPRIQIVHNPFDRMSPCNMPIENFPLTPNYVRK
jgi:hypothetical protein